MKESAFSFPLQGKPGCRWQMHDRGRCTVAGDVLTVEDGWASAEALKLANLSFAFDARCPADAPQVQIWAGVRHYSRDYRYLVALRGGNNNHIYLARMGAEGYDKMLALRPLEFSPQPGVWYHLRIVFAGQTIAVYLGDEKKPLLCYQDEDAPFAEGSVSVGGSYLPTEFRNLQVEEVAPDALRDVVKAPDYLDTVTPTPAEKEQQRRRERAAYRPYVVPALPEERLELSLNGNWLFVPGYEATAQPQAKSFDDAAAHVMAVPASWVPLRAWLEGENMKDLNKGMNDSYLVEETTRCRNLSFDYEATKYAWYRHYLDLPKGIRQKRVVLDFEGIALISAVYFNGVKVHENIGMFAPQQVDVSDYLVEGRNVIAVEVHRALSSESEHAFDSAAIDDNYATAWDILDADGEVSTKFSRREFCTNDIPHGFYGGQPGGIWRKVKLIITAKTHLEECYFRPTLQDASIQLQYANSGDTAQAVTLSYAITHKATGELLCSGKVEDASLAAGERRTVAFQTPTVQPHLWGPGAPSLYDLCLRLCQDGVVVDTLHETVGFRTVEFRGETLYYNGKPLWVRGGNHMPAHVKPNDRALATAFMRQALAHNVIATRTHVAPWTSVWLDAADEAGLLISFEGTWTWLMLEHIPSKRSIAIWKAELEALLKRHRNRPSLFLLTMNNEMKFYLHEAPDEVVIEKGRILQGGIELERKTIPHLPLVCDSAYYRNHAVKTGRYERIIRAHGYDDGDMDDPHGYYGWYNPCFFHFMRGEFGAEYTTPGRPCMSQECATGYPRAEDGLPTRAYLYMHQTPQTTVGKKAYEYNDPAYFLARHAMLTKELAETLRRVEHGRTCGVILFAFETWFYQQNNAARIQPMRAARCLKTAYQPVLASAELWGRHFYAGSTISTTITLINDSLSGEALAGPVVEATLVAGDAVLAAESIPYGDLPYFQTRAKSLCLAIPAQLPAERVEAKLVLKVRCGGEVLSRNEYELLLASPAWGQRAACPEPCYYPADDAASAALLARYAVNAQPCGDVAALVGQPGRLVVSGTPGEALAAKLHAFAAAGGRVVLLAQKALPDALLGGLSAPFTANRQEIVTMNIPESTAFDGLEPLDLAWFADGCQVPYAALGRYSVDRFSPAIQVLAETLEWHGYINKPTDYKQFGGTPLFSANIGKGQILVSALRTDAVDVDPVDSRLTANLIAWDFDQH
ncbi:MAG: hypothetical protein PHO10_03805 [Gemmiger sp.]|nr:hypothetical protein [Gemmiger sp.]